MGDPDAPTNAPSMSSTTSGANDTWDKPLPDEVLKNPPPDEGERYKGWSMSDEREFIEGLLHTRMAILLTFVAIIFAGALSENVKPLSRSLLLTFGSLVAFGLALATQRAQDKLHAVLRLFKQTDKKHPAVQLNDLVTTRSAFQWVGICAWGVVGAIVVSAVASFLDLFCIYSL
jgi:hypothetical protein